mgnify:CR=1 FL=1
MSVSNTTKRVKEIRRKTRRKFSSEEKIRIVLNGCFAPRWFCIGLMDMLWLSAAQFFEGDGTYITKIAVTALTAITHLQAHYRA